MKLLCFSPESLIPEVQYRKDSKVHRSKNEKFHKLFPNVPSDELVINTFSCAYFGDILFQGFLYISSSYFCFYSKILGHETRLEIPLESVINITRERTAFVIPNAIGILSTQDKYVFGSLMARDKTYRLMINVWKTFLPNKKGLEEIEQEESSVGTQSDDESKQNLIELSVDSSDDSSNQCPNCGILQTESVSKLQVKEKSDCETSHKPGALHNEEKSNNFVINRTNLTLIVCSLLVVILSVSAFFLTVRLFNLQNQIEHGFGVDEITAAHSRNPYILNYNLKQIEHSANIHHLHSVLRANIDALKEVGDSLSHLATSSKHSKPTD
ncbi:DgyrCDS2052 [Dimorphilus gyrociliatus]|uniref:DgyrCDS2052 n=1 Tax=Dimorphilus gyrociliatus TaxID=2664684 RepID=A0A7I8VE71_9ANNE|nr:DgyrCDS2052 [Dimorphilus gyrociliatus]